MICPSNQLTSLPELPPNLRFLTCNFNQLTSLPALPDSLLMLNCGNNQITSLPELPNGLQVLIFNNNQITSIPRKLPDALQLISGTNNPLPQVNYILKWPARGRPNIININLQLIDRSPLGEEVINKIKEPASLRKLATMALSTAELQEARKYNVLIPGDRREFKDDDVHGGNKRMNRRINKRRTKRLIKRKTKSKNKTKNKRISTKRK